MVVWPLDVFKYTRYDYTCQHFMTTMCYSLPMTDKIRKELRKAWGQQGKSPADAARAIGVERQYVNRMLNQGVGDAPQSWVDLLADAGLELTVKPKETSK